MEIYRVSAAQESAAGLIPAHVRRIAEFGLHAASGDNCQPWKLRWANDQLDLSIDVERARNPFADEKLDVATLLAHGGLLENMEAAARADGYDMSCQIFPETSAPLLVARVRFSRAAAPQPSPLAAFIEQRCTDRRPYARGPLRPDDRAALLAAASSSGCGLALCEDREIMSTLADALGGGDRLLCAVLPLHSFLFEHIRWNRKEIELSRDGLDARNLGLGALRPAFRLLSSWPLTQILNKLGLQTIIAKKSSRLYSQSAAFGLITTTGRSKQDYVECGRVLQRVWLTAASRGLAFQPLTALLYFANYLNEDIASNIPNALKEIRRSAQRVLESAFPSAKPAGVPVMLFRVGKTDAPRPFASLRRPLAAHMA